MPDVLATFDREPELIDVAALHLLERHFAPGLHEEILEAVGLEFGVKGSATGAAGALRVLDGGRARSERSIPNV